MKSLFDDIEHGILSPLLHLKEFDSHWMLEFDLPLVNKKDIKITFDENSISVEAKLREIYSEEKHDLLNERMYANTSRFDKSLLNYSETDQKEKNISRGQIEIRARPGGRGREL